MFEDYKIPRTKNFNPDSPSGASWVSKLPKLTDKQIKKNDGWQRKRLQALQAVDDMVGDVVDRLDKAGALDNTYIFYTSDNGYHISQHRMKPGKMCGFETDINVPFVVRGPNITQGKVRKDPSSHTDIGPTIMKLAGNSIDNKKFDGSAMNLWEEPESGHSEHLGVEFWGVALEEGYPSKHPNNTYKGLRIEADKYAFYYSVWCNNEKELYNMKVGRYCAKAGGSADIVRTTRSSSTICWAMTTKLMRHCCLSIHSRRLQPARCPYDGPQVVQGELMHRSMEKPTPRRQRQDPRRRTRQPLR